jgi:DNA/RNA endonuclease YhcR with UshA esterase domain
VGNNRPSKDINKERLEIKDGKGNMNFFLSLENKDDEILLKKVEEQTQIEGGKKALEN